MSILEWTNPDPGYWVSINKLFEIHKQLGTNVYCLWVWNPRKLDFQPFQAFSTLKQCKRKADEIMRKL